MITKKPPTKPPIKDEMLRTLVQVARLYYERDLSQQAIADKLGVSRSLIAKYLLQSKEQGIVKIQVIDPSERSDELADMFAERFDLQYVEVVPNTHASAALTLQAVAGAAANYYADHVQDGEVTGLAWGRSIKSLVDQLPDREIVADNLGVIPLLGESSNPRLHSRMNALVEQMADAVAAEPRFLFYPVTVESKGLHNRIVKEPALVEINESWDSMDWVFLGIGATPPTAGMAVYVPENALPRLEREGAVGDVCCRYFDADGEFVRSPFENQIIGVSVDQLRSAGRVVAVVAGNEKARAVLGALKTGLIETLFIDQALARAVLDRMDDEE